MQTTNFVSTSDLLKPRPWLLLIILAAINPFFSYQLLTASNLGECFSCFILIALWIVPGFIFGLLPFQKSTRLKNILILLGLSILLELSVRLVLRENIFDGLIIANLLVLIGWPIGLVIFTLVNKLIPQFYPFVFLKLPLWVLLILVGALYVTNYFLFGPRHTADFFEISIPIIGMIVVLLFIYRISRKVYNWI